jgi:eukaryotic-like serine/threonine-protein kinase
MQVGQRSTIWAKPRSALACGVTQDLIGSYRLLRHVATGGMAEIFLARDDRTHNAPMVVLKRMLPQLTARADFVQMFVDEGQLTLRLRHPQIVQVKTVSEDQGVHFMVMELVDGPHLGALFAQSLRDRTPLPLSLCVYIIAQAARGLHHAHELRDDHGRLLQLVHRDISPQNILVSRFGEVKVTDFGVAKADNQRTKTRTGIIKGKVAYMSPEQCLGDTVDRRTDVFALGIVLYELLTRRRLFRDKSDLLVMQRITSSTVADSSTLNDEVDSELDGIVRSALCKQADQRTDTAFRLAEQLEGWLAKHAPLVNDAVLAGWFDTHVRGLAPSLSLPEEDRQTWVAPPSHQAEATRGTPSLQATLALQSAIANRTELGDSRPTIANTMPSFAPAFSSDDLVGDDPATIRLPAKANPTIAVLDVATPKTPTTGIDNMPAERAVSTPRRWAAAVGVAGALMVCAVAAWAWWPEPVVASPPIAMAEPAMPTVPVVVPVVAVEPTPVELDTVVDTIRGDVVAANVAGKKKPPVKKVEAPAAVATTGKGTIRIRTKPWTYATLGGVALGETPFERPTASGERALLLVNPKEGIRERLMVNVPADGTLTVDVRFRQVDGQWVVESKVVK